MASLLWIFVAAAALLAILYLQTKNRKHVGDLVSYHVINLDRSPDRLVAFKTRAAAAGLGDVQRWAATDTRRITKEQTIAAGVEGDLYDAAAKKGSFGVIGATLSHRRLLQHLETVTADPADLHAIFEDDAQIPQDFLARWEHVKPFLPADYDVVYFGYTFPNQHKVCGPINAANPAWMNGGKTGNVGVFAYAVRHGALPKINAYMAHSHTAFDNQLAQMGTAWGLYYVSPEIVPHDYEVASTIVPLAP
jgi:GR25 family glycosyltransferase involved in LPS biosynthesis